MRSGQCRGLWCSNPNSDGTAIQQPCRCAVRVPYTVYCPSLPVRSDATLESPECTMSSRTPVLLVVLSLILTKTLLFTATAEAEACAGPQTAQHLVARWQPHARKHGVCNTAIRCVHSALVRVVLVRCATAAELAQTMGDATPQCVQRCVCYKRQPECN